MAELSLEKTVEYLKNVSALETSLYKQTEVIKQAKKDLKKPKVIRENIVKPQRAFVGERPTLPELSNYLKSEIGSFLFGCIALFFLSFLCVCLDAGLIFIIVMVITLILGVIFFRAIMTKYSNDKMAYYKNYPRYVEDTEKAQKQYEIEMQRYADSVKYAEEKYVNEQEKAKNVYKIASEEVSKLDKPMLETQELLNKIYNADIIFPKYRNMVAMCTIYEYFASGRCTELTGPNGAYNLYEAELRQNLIIDQLEQVNANLEQIRKNQYILYQSISETNQLLEDISSDINKILSLTADIAVSSKITAFCSQVTAVNSMAQTYL